MSDSSVFDTRRHFLLVIVSLLVLAPARPSDAREANAAPLGVELGVATRAQVRAKLDKVTKLEDHGVNKFSNGPMLQGDGAGLGVDGLKEITFIFDKAEVLQGVLMTLEKNFKPTYEMLRRRYKLVGKQIPFVGDTWAKFSQGDSVITLDAPHLSFEMTLHYLSQGLLEAFNSQTARDKARHAQEQEGRL